MQPHASRPGRLVVERRKTVRLPFGVQASLANLYFAPDSNYSVQIMNISSSGVCIQLGYRLDVGSHVEIKWPHFAVFGEVRYCQELEPGSFKAGIEIETVINTAFLNSSDHLSRSTMVLFLVGLLPVQDMEAVGLHLKACAACKNDLVIIEDRILG